MDNYKLVYQVQSARNHDWSPATVLVLDLVVSRALLLFHFYDYPPTTDLRVSRLQGVLQ